MSILNTKQIVNLIAILDKVVIQIHFTVSKQNISGRNWFSYFYPFLRWTFGIIKKCYRKKLGKRKKTCRSLYTFLQKRFANVESYFENFKNQCGPIKNFAHVLCRISAKQSAEFLEILHRFAKTINAHCKNVRLVA